MSKPWGGLGQILWPSQKTWTLIKWVNSWKVGKTLRVCAIKETQGYWRPLGLMLEQLEKAELNWKGQNDCPGFAW